MCLFKKTQVIAGVNYRCSALRIVQEIGSSFLTVNDWDCSTEADPVSKVHDTL